MSGIWANIRLSDYIDLDKPGLRRIFTKYMGVTRATVWNWRVVDDIPKHRLVEFLKFIKKSTDRSGGIR